MMNAILLRGAIAPALIALGTSVTWLAFDASVALGVLAIGALILVSWHLFHLWQLGRWAAGSIETPVPEGRGVWAIAYGELYRRVRLRSARQRDLRLALDRFVRGAEALPDGVVVLDPRNRIEWANPRAEVHLGGDIKHDVGAPIVNLVRHPAFIQYPSVGGF